VRKYSALPGGLLRGVKGVDFARTKNVGGGPKRRTRGGGLKTPERSKRNKSRNSHAYNTGG